MQKDERILRINSAHRTGLFLFVCCCLFWLVSFNAELYVSNQVLTGTEIPGGQWDNNNNNNVHLACAHQRPERSKDIYILT